MLNNKLYTIQFVIITLFLLILSICNNVIPDDLGNYYHFDIIYRSLVVISIIYFMFLTSLKFVFFSHNLTINRKIIKETTEYKIMNKLYM